MGCCESCFGKKEGYHDEQSPLLEEGNVVPVNSAHPVNPTFDSPIPTPAGSLSQSKHDEQSILAGIIHQYNSDVIDITSLDSKIDAVEYMNRVQTYNRKVAALTGGNRYKIPPLYSSGNDPVAVLGRPPVDLEDVLMISQLSGELRAALNSVKITKQKDLVLSLSHR